MINDANAGGPKYSIWKRISIFLIDGLMSLISFLLLFFALGTFTIEKIATNNIKEMNQYSTAIYIREDLPFEKNWPFYIAELDYDKFIDHEVSKNITVEDANSHYNETIAKIEKELNEIPEYKDAYNKFYLTYITTVLISVSIPLFIFQLVIPITNKKHQTLSMMIFKATVVDSSTSTYISNVKVLLRFFILYTLEFLLIYILINWIGIIFVGLVTFCVISFTNNRSTIHDLITKTKVQDLEYCYQPEIEEN